jgi:hypothetical protein
MAVAFDAFSNGTAGTGDISWTHTPVGTPRGVIVIVLGVSGTDGVSGVTYGGSAMTEVTGSPNLKASTELAGVYVYFLGTSIPTGAQTVAMTSANVHLKSISAITLTADADTEVVDSDATINSDSAADPSVTLSLGGRTAFAAIGLVSGQDAVTGITPLTDWTSRLEQDAGAVTVGHYTYDTIGSTDVTAGWTQTAEDATAIALAVSEVAGGGDPEGRLLFGKLIGGGLLLKGVLN